MTSMKEYARRCGVSYEAVRQQVKRYSADLEGHIHKQGRTQYLDDWAVDFLNAKRMGNPVVVAQTDLHDQLAALQDENKALLLKVAAQADELAAAYKQLGEAQKQALLLPAAEEATQKAWKEAQEAQEEAERLRGELEVEKSKTWLQRLLGR